MIIIIFALHVFINYIKQNVWYKCWLLLIRVSDTFPVYDRKRPMRVTQENLTFETSGLKMWFIQKCLKSPFRNYNLMKPKHEIIWNKRYIVYIFTIRGPVPSNHVLKSGIGQPARLYVVLYWTPTMGVLIRLLIFN